MSMRTRMSDSRATAPATRSLSIDPDGAEPIAYPIEGAKLMIGTAGDVVVDAIRDADGTKTVFKNQANGSLLPVRVKRVYGAADGTTATDLVLVW